MDDYTKEVENALEKTPEEVTDFIFTDKKLDIFLEGQKKKLILSEGAVISLKACLLNFLLDISDQKPLMDEIKNNISNESSINTFLNDLNTEILNPILILNNENFQNNIETDTIPTPVIPNTAPAPVNIWQNKMEGSVGTAPAKTTMDIKPSLPIGIDPYKEIPN